MRGRDIIALLGAPLIARPLAARANGGAVIGYLHNFSQKSNVPYLAFFREGLSDIGFIEGQNWQSNIAGPKADTISSPRWSLTLSPVRLT